MGNIEGAINATACIVRPVEKQTRSTSRRFVSNTTLSCARAVKCHIRVLVPLEPGISQEKGPHSLITGRENRASAVEHHLSSTSALRLLKYSRKIGKRSRLPLALLDTLWRIAYSSALFQCLSALQTVNGIAAPGSSIVVTAIVIELSDALIGRCRPVRRLVGRRTIATLTGVVSCRCAVWSGACVIAHHVVQVTGRALIAALRRIVTTGP